MTHYLLGILADDLSGLGLGLNQGLGGCCISSGLWVCLRVFRGCLFAARIALLMQIISVEMRRHEILEDHLTASPGLPGTLDSTSS